MLDKFTDDELRAELKRREEIEKVSNKPKQLNTVDLEPLRKVCQEYIDDIANGKYIDEDFEHYIFETALETIFGKNMWSWINKREKGY